MLPRLLLDNKNRQKKGQNSIISSFFAKKASAEGRSPPQELEVGPRSGPYLLVQLKSGCCAQWFVAVGLFFVFRQFLVAQVCPLFMSGKSHVAETRPRPALINFYGAE